MPTYLYHCEFCDEGFEVLEYRFDHEKICAWNPDNKVKNQYNSDYCTHPGEIIREHLATLEEDKTNLLQKRILYLIMIEKYPVTPDYATWLEELTGRPAGFWLNLQKQYDDWVKKNEHV